MPIRRRRRDPLLVFSVLYSFWVADYVAFNGDGMRELATQFMRLAEKHGATVPLMVGHRLMGMSLVETGEIVQGLEHYNQALTLYDPAEHRPLATLFGQDIQVSVLSYRSRALWMLGHPEAALADAEQAISGARVIGQAAVLMYALSHAAFSNIHCGDYVRASAVIDELVGLAEEKGSLFWMASGMMSRGVLFALTDKAADAVHTLSSSISAYRSTGSTAVTMQLSVAYLAKVHTDLGRFGDAWRCIEEAMTMVETTGERWFEAEVNRVAGEIALLSSEREKAKAEAYLQRALVVARQQQAKSWELRASMSLARLWREQGKVQQARELLAPVYGWFTEAFDTRDLKEAKALLGELGA
jgi:predicted ATPase